MDVERFVETLDLAVDLVRERLLGGLLARAAAQAGRRMRFASAGRARV
jgi:hypothetical protein